MTDHESARGRTLRRYATGVVGALGAAAMASLRSLQALAQPKNTVKQGGIIGSEAERMRREEALKESKLTELLYKKSEAESHLSQGQFEAAIPVALEAMTLSVELYGNESIDVVPRPTSARSSSDRRSGICRRRTGPSSSRRTALSTSARSYTAASASCTRSRGARRRH